MPSFVFVSSTRKRRHLEASWRVSWELLGHLLCLSQFLNCWANFCLLQRALDLAACSTARCPKKQNPTPFVERNTSKAYF